MSSRPAPPTRVTTFVRNGEHYQFNLDTKGWAAGRYRLEVQLDDGNRYSDGDHLALADHHVRRADITLHERPVQRGVRGSRTHAAMRPGHSPGAGRRSTGRPRARMLRCRLAARGGANDS